MEDVVLRMPSADVALLSLFAERMGWTIDRRQNVVSRFIDACTKNDSPMSDEEILRQGDEEIAEGNFTPDSIG